MLSQTESRTNIDTLSNVDLGLSITEADGFRTRVQKLAKDINTETWEIGEILYKISEDENHVRRWGYHSWTHWAEIEIGLDSRKAYYLRTTYHWFAIEHSFPELLLDKLKGLPWTKTRLLAGRVTPENAAKWIELAESKTRDELDRLIKQAATNESESSLSPSAIETDDTGEVEHLCENEENEVWMHKKFTLADTPGDQASQYAIVEYALKRAKELSESDKDGHNLVMICVDFLANNDFRTASDPKNRLRYLAKIEELMGIRLFAICKRNEEIIYGLELLDDFTSDDSD